MSGSLIKRITRNKAFSLALIMFAVWIIFFLINHNYFVGENFTGIMNSSSLSGTIAIGLACLMMSGSIDLSAGAEGCLGGVIVALFLRTGMNWVLALVLTILCGVVMGLINAFWVNAMKLMPFISTIAMSSIYQAMATIITKSSEVAIGEGAFTKLGTGHIGIFPFPFIIMVVLMIIYGLMLNYTKFGRRLILCGGNRTAARLAGINHQKITTIMFANCGAISALAGAILAARMNNGGPRAVLGSEMDAMTAAIIGGVSFLGGGTSGMGTIFVALLLVNSFNNGLQVIKVNSFWQFVTRGGLLILALIVDYFRESRRQKALKQGAKV